MLERTVENLTDAWDGDDGEEKDETTAEPIFTRNSRTGENYKGKITSFSSSIVDLVLCCYMYNPFLPRYKHKQYNMDMSSWNIT